jgi:catechol 2,3-dioxygenase-like lactoylglutathione lyase family enzyme
MRLQSSYPVLLTDDPQAARDFYGTHFGFTPTYESDWYVSLRHAEAPQYELAFVRYDHPTVPAAGRQVARGVILNFEVADAAAAWERLGAAGVPVLLALRDEAFGQRHFILEGPGGVMLDVIENIPPTPEFADRYAQA